jgi:hypothetical protein
MAEENAAVVACRLRLKATMPALVTLQAKRACVVGMGWMRRSAFN